MTITYAELMTVIKNVEPVTGRDVNAKQYARQKVRDLAPSTGVVNSQTGKFEPDLDAYITPAELGSLLTMLAYDAV